MPSRGFDFHESMPCTVIYLWYKIVSLKSLGLLGAALNLDFRLTIFPRACVGPQHMLKQCLSINYHIENRVIFKDNHLIAGSRFSNVCSAYE